MRYYLVTLFRASKRPRKFGTRKTAKVENCFSSQWNRWVATDIHLDQSSLLRNQWYPLHCVPRWEGKVFTESASWWVACLAGEVVLLSLLKVVTKLWLEGLDLFNQSGYMIFLCVEGIFTLCCSLVNLLLLDRRFLVQGYSGCSVLLFSFWTYCEEAKFCSMRYYLVTLFRWNSSRNYLWYS